METLRQKTENKRYRALSGIDKVRSVYDVQTGILHTLDVLFGPQREDGAKKLVSDPYGKNIPVS